MFNLALLQYWSSSIFSENKNKLFLPKKTRSRGFTPGKMFVVVRPVNNWQNHCQSENVRGFNGLLLPHAGYAYGPVPSSDDVELLQQPHDLIREPSSADDCLWWFEIVIVEVRPRPMSWSQRPRSAWQMVTNTKSGTTKSAFKFGRDDVLNLSIRKRDRMIRGARRDYIQSNVARIDQIFRNEPEISNTDVTNMESPWWL